MSQSYDAVIIGSGAAGMASAAAAAEFGLSCVVLEKSEKLGGGSAISGGSLWVGANHLNAAAGGSDSPAEVVDYLRYVGAGGIDEGRMQTFVEEAPPALKFFEALGIPFQLTSRIDHYHGVAPGAKSGGRIVDTPPIAGADLREFRDRMLLPAGRLFRHGGNELAKLGGPSSAAAWDEALLAERERQDMRGGGTGLVGWFVRIAAARGVAIRTGVAVDRLITEAGRVSGVVTAAGERIAARRGVVIACGGYESNPELVANYEALPGFQSMFPDGITGDGLVMATEIGAAVRVIGNNLSVFMGFRNPDDAPPGGTAMCRLSGTQELPSKHTMVVNRHGRRFTDETFFQAAAPSLRVFDVDTREQPNLPCFFIFDAQYARGHSFAGRKPGAPIPSWVASGATLAEVAAKLGIDAAALQATADRFSADARRGIDGGFHRGETPRGLTKFAPGATLGTIEEKPFYGIELHPTSLASAGVLADQRARVLHVRGMPIPGLYAVGNAAARTETGSGYQTGFSLASAITFGLIAARDMAQSNRERVGMSDGFGPASQDALFKKLLWRLVPFLFFAYVISSLDRINVGIASLTMARDIGLGAAALGLGFGIFSAGYVCCEIPSNLALHRFGARIWIARIMITWGLVSMGTFLVTNAYNFYAARFILGVAEAGFVPGIVYYLTLWFPAVWRAKAMVAFLVAIPITGVIGSPISGALLGMEGIWGLHGWQWLFIIEGLPAIILGVMCLFVLTDRPEQARWLSETERGWLQGVLARESAAMEQPQSFSVAQVLTNGRVITLSAVNFCYIVGNQGIGIWIPQVVKGFGLTNLQVGFVTALPFLCGSIGMILWARHSDRAQERTWHVVGAGLVAAAALATSAAVASPVLALIALTIGVTGIYGFFGTFWAIPPSFLTGRAAAAGIAMIISIGNCGGLVGPSVVGWTRELTGSFTLGFVAMSCFFVVASLLIIALHFTARIHEVSLPVDQPAGE